MAATISVRPNHRPSVASSLPRPTGRRIDSFFARKSLPWLAVPFQFRLGWTRTASPIQAGSRADDSAPFDMSLESALNLLGVSEEASFDEILRAKNSIVATCKDNQEMIGQVEAAYDMLLMRSLSRRRAGKVVNNSIRYADVKTLKRSGMGSLPQWLQATMKNPPVSVDKPVASDLSVQAGVYGALMVLTYVNGTSTSSLTSYGGADVPGLILAGSFGASLYFMTKKNIKLGKATVITIGGLVAGAVVGSAVENWLQVDIVPFLVYVNEMIKMVDHDGKLDSVARLQDSWIVDKRRMLMLLQEITSRYLFSLLSECSAKNIAIQTMVSVLRQNISDRHDLRIQGLLGSL